MTIQEANEEANKSFGRLPKKSLFPQLLTWHQYRMIKGLTHLELLEQVYLEQVKAYTLGNNIYFKKSDLMQELKEWDLKALEQSKSKI